MNPDHIGALLGAITVVLLLAWGIAVELRAARPPKPVFRPRTQPACSGRKSGRVRTS